LQLFIVFAVLICVVENGKTRFFKKGENRVGRKKKPLISRKINGFFKVFFYVILTCFF